MMSGKSVWLDDEVLDEVEERSVGDESPNKTLRRILLDDYGVDIVTREEVEEIAERKAENKIEEYKNRY